LSFVFLSVARCVAIDGLPLLDDGRCAGEGEGEGEGGEGEGEGEGAWPTVCCALTAADGTVSFVYLTEERCVANNGLPLQDDGRCAGEGEGEGEGGEGEGEGDGGDGDTVCCERILVDGTPSYGWTPLDRCERAGGHEVDPRSCR
jgi:hypothetical protein